MKKIAGDKVQTDERYPYATDGFINWCKTINGVQPVCPACGALMERISIWWKCFAIQRMDHSKICGLRFEARD